LAKQTESDEHHCSIKQQIGLRVLFRRFKLWISEDAARGMKASCALDRVVWFEHALGWAGLGWAGLGWVGTAQRCPGWVTFLLDGWVADVLLQCAAKS